LQLGPAGKKEDPMKGILIAAFIVLSAGVSAAGLLYGQGGKHSAAAQSASSLTPEQQKSLAAFKDAAIAKAAPMRAELRDTLVEIRRLFAVDKPDRQAILAKQAETEPIHRKLREVWTDFALQVHGILNPQQRTVWAESGWGMGPGMGIGPGMGRGPSMGRGRRGGRGPATGMAVDVGMCPFECPMCPAQPE
jgi:Spy/CpxP family protein refolding chaperone